MAQSGGILTGQAVEDILKELKRNSTILQMHLQGTNFKKLTVIIGLAKKGEKRFFTVDSPPGFEQAASSRGRWSIYFTFTDADGVPYSFSSAGGNRSFLKKRNAIRLEYPARIERKQRRKHLRVKPPVGSVTTAIIDGKPYDIQIINISLGGALVMFSSPDVQKRVVSRGKEIRDIMIDMFPGREDRSPVKINRAVVRRVITEQVSNKEHYGLMFIDMSQEDTARLKEYIYANQRQVLRKAVMPDA